jgi:hypothetical protein
VHFFGAATLSFADGLRVAPGERWEIEARDFGPPLVNRLAAMRGEAVSVRSLG